jgi:hypothetical protein
VALNVYVTSVPDGALSTEAVSAGNGLNGSSGFELGQLTMKGLANVRT